MTSATDVRPGHFREAIGQTFESLQTRNFRLFFIGQTISNSGNWLTNVALTLLVLHLTGSGIAVGLLAACQYGPILVLSPAAGAVADRSDKRKLLFYTQGLEMAQSVGLAILAFLPHPPLVGLYVIALAGGILLSLDNPLRRSFVSEMVPKSAIPNAVVLYSTIVNVSRIFGPALAGLLADKLGFGWCFTLDALSYSAVIFCLYLMRPAELYRQPVKLRGRGAVVEGIRYIASQPVLWIPYAMLVAIGTLAYNFNVSLPLFVTGALHQSGKTFTFLYSAFSLGAVASALAVARRAMVRMRHILGGGIALGCMMLLLSAAPNVYVATPIIFFTGAASILYMTATTAIVQVEAKPEMHGRILALQTAVVGGSSALGGPIVGGLADFCGARSPLVLGGVVCLLTVCLGAFAARRHEVLGHETSKNI